MLKPREILVAMCVLLAVPTGAMAGKVTLTPVAHTTIEFDPATHSEVLLLRFSLPDNLANACIIRSVLHFDIDCRPGENISAWVSLSPIEWDAESVDYDWWPRAEALLEESKVAVFETLDCSTHDASCDIARWVRSSLVEGEQYLDLVLRRPPQEGGRIRSKERNGSGAPTLVIVHSQRAIHQ